MDKYDMICSAIQLCITSRLCEQCPFSHPWEPGSRPCDEALTLAAADAIKELKSENTQLKRRMAMADYEQLIKALRTCAAKTDCISCHYVTLSCFRPDQLMDTAADVIEELKSEISQLKKEGGNG